MTPAQIKTQLKRTLKNVTWDQDEACWRDQLIIRFDPKGMPMDKIADLGVTLRQFDTLMNHGSDGFGCQLSCCSITDHALEGISDAVTQMGFTMDDLVNLEVHYENDRVIVHPIKLKPVRYIVIQNGICQADDYGLLNGVYLGFDDGEYCIEHVLALGLLEDSNDDNA